MKTAIALIAALIATPALAYTCDSPVMLAAVKSLPQKDDVKLFAIRNVQGDFDGVTLTCTGTGYLSNGIHQVLWTVTDLHGQFDLDFYIVQ